MTFQLEYGSPCCLSPEADAEVVLRSPSNSGLKERYLCRWRERPELNGERKIIINALEGDMSDQKTVGP